MPIASGKYEHRESGLANGISETWEYNLIADMVILDIVFQARQTLNAKVHFDTNSQPTHFEYHIDDTLNGRYHIENNKLKVRRTLPYDTILEDTLVWSEKTVLDLPFLSCKSHTILHLLQHGTAPTFAPILRSGDRAGDLAKKSASFIGLEEISLDGIMYQAKHFRYLHDYWLDKHNTILRMRDNECEVILVEYER